MHAKARSSTAGLPSGARIEVVRNGLPVAALGRGGQAQQHLRAHSLHEGIKPISRQAMTLIDDDRMPVVGRRTVVTRLRLVTLSMVAKT